MAGSKKSNPPVSEGVSRLETRWQKIVSRSEEFEKVGKAVGLAVGLVMAAGTIFFGCISDDDDGEAAPLDVATSSSPGFTARLLQIRSLSDDAVYFQFASTANTSYRATIRDTQGSLVYDSPGRAEAGIWVVEGSDGLSPGADYVILVELGEDFSLAAPRAFVRTSGGQARSTTEAVRLQNLGVTRIEDSNFKLEYETNICGNGSFVVEHLETGTVVGMNEGQTSGGCGTSHLAEPGIWSGTEELQPNSSYVIRVTVTGDQLEDGSANTDCRQIEIRTASAGGQRDGQARQAVECAS